MTHDLELRRCALGTSYQRHVAADRAWHLAKKETLTWFPTGRRASDFPIGNPSSPLRQILERRNKALARMAVAHLKLRVAQRRQVKELRIIALPPH